ncbi:hypothetical protein N0V94_009170 [Neodidymelliopsis sp. IMI 364377]|nr:hypothetical protein N0V94_009170 [Neodidymelliopsis sp. IMI 364377]
MDIRPPGHLDEKPESSEQIFNHPSIQQDVEEPNSTTPRTKMRMFAIITALFLSLFVAALDGTILSTAAPTISRQLNSAAGYTWIGGAFNLASAASGPIWAKLSDIWGRKLIVLLALAVFFASSTVFIAAEYYIPLFLQSVLEASPLRSGVLLLPFILTGAVAGVGAGVIIHRTGHFREIMWVGTLFMCLGFGLFISFDANTSTARAVGFQLIAGLGSGVLFEAPLIAIQSQVKQQDVATATASMAFVRTIAVAISVIIGGTIFQNSMSARSGFLRDAGLPQSLLDQLDGENALANVMLPSTLENPAWEIATKQAFAWATRNMWITYTVFAFLAFVASLFIEAAHLGTEHVETVTGLRKEKQSPRSHDL